MLGPQRRSRFFLATLFCVLVTACGTEVPTQLATSTQTDTAARFNQRLTKHQSASSYAGRHQIRLQFDHGGQGYDETVRCDVQFTRPNQLHFTVTSEDDSVHVWTADDSLWAAIQDPARPGLSHQWVRRELPNQLTAAEIYAATEMMDPGQPNQMLSALMGLPVSIDVTPLGMLLGDCGLTPLLQGPHEVQLLEPSTIGQDACERFELTTQAGQFVFWFEAGSEALRRVEYPTHELFQQLATDQRPQQVRLAIDLSPYVPDMVRRAPQRPDDVRVLNYFVIPPNLLPTADYGKTIADMSFRDDQHNMIGSGGTGRPLVLTWFDGHDLSRATLSRLQPLVDEFRDGVDFLAVSAALPSGLPTGSLTELARRWQVTLPMAFDNTAAGRDLLDISQAPTVVVLDKDRQLQQYVVGANPNIGQLVKDTLGQLLDGQNVAATVVATAEREQSRFNQYLAAAAAESLGESENSLPVADFPPRSLRLATAWQLTDVRPGNLSLLPNDDGSPRSLVVVHGDHRVTEVDLDGRVRARHSLDEARDDPITYLRSTMDATGEPVLLGFTPYGQSISVMNDEFRETNYFSSSDDQRIVDAQVSDLDHDGTPEIYVGFNQPFGCARMDLAGENVWSATSIDSGLSVAMSGDEVWVASGQGLIHRFAADGAPRGAPRMLGQRPIHAIFGRHGKTSHGAAELLGLSHSLQGRPIAVAFGADFTENWSYGLTEGRYAYPVPVGQWTELLGDAGQWLLVAPDSSVHLVEHDGSFHDSFGLGTAIYGIVGHPTANRVGRLYIATENSLTCYEVSRD